MANPQKERSYRGERIEPSDLKFGDDIYVHKYHPIRSYQHHGIYAGLNDDGQHTIIDFTPREKGVKVGKGIISKRLLEDFCGGKDRDGKDSDNNKELYRVTYNTSFWEYFFSASGSVQMKHDCFPPAEVVKRADALMKNPDKWEEYHYLNRNCEQFCVFCKTGVIVSGADGPGQAQTAIISVVSAVGGIAFAVAAATAGYFLGGSQDKKPEDKEKLEAKEKSKEIEKPEDEEKPKDKEPDAKQ